MFYLDFVAVNESYISYLQQEEGLKADYEVVNGLDSTAYTNAVEIIYTECKASYDNHMLKIIQQEVRELCEQIENIWDQVDKDTDNIRMQVAAEKLRGLMKELKPYKDKRREHPGADWGEVMEEIRKGVFKCDCHRKCYHSDEQGPTEGALLISS